MMTDPMAQHLASIGVPKSGLAYERHVRECGYHGCRAAAMARPVPPVERVHAGDLLPGDIITTQHDMPDDPAYHARIVAVEGPYLSGYRNGQYTHAWSVDIRCRNGIPRLTAGPDTVFLRVRSVLD